MITKEKHAHRVFFLRDHAERAAEVMPAVWLITANYNQTRAPAQRRRSWYGTGVIPVLCNPPRGTPRGLALGLAILLAATTTLEFKIRIEERFMTAEFPEEYPRYRGRHPLASIQGGWGRRGTSRTGPANKGREPPCLD